METNKIDSIFRKSINESENYFEMEANDAKSRIWNQVQLQNKKKSLPLLFRLLVAACILLFISTSILFVSNLKTRKEINELVEINADLKNKADSNTKKELTQKEPLLAANLNSTDTIFIEKAVVVEKPIIQTARIVDTVYIQQIVYREKELLPESTIAAEKVISTDTVLQIIADNYQTEILINNSKALKKEKSKKFKLKFGGNQNTSNEGNITLSSRL